MKTKHYIAAVLLVAALGLFSSCKDDGYAPNPDLLVGTWVEGSEYYIYADHDTTCVMENDTRVVVNGTTWDASEVEDADRWSQPFNWTLDGDELTQIHRTTMGAQIPKTFTITQLNGSTLVYRDKYGTSHNFSRVQ